MRAADELPNGSPVLARRTPCHWLAGSRDGQGESVTAIFTQGTDTAPLPPRTFQTKPGDKVLYRGAHRAASRNKGGKTREPRNLNGGCVDQLPGSTFNVMDQLKINPRAERHGIFLNMETPMALLERRICARKVLR